MATEAPAAAPALFRLWPKQMYAFNEIFVRKSQQVLYGGAAGGAKSHFTRAIAVHVAHLWVGSSFGIFRRTDNELLENHIEIWQAEVAPFVQGGVWQEQKKQFQWPSPPWCWCDKGAPCAHSSKTKFRHVDADRGAQKHQGSQFAGIGIDEATHFLGDDIDFLYTRVRASAAELESRDIVGPDGKTYHYPGWGDSWVALGLMTANPGDVGEKFMIDNFIEPEAGVELAENEDKTIVNGPHPLLNEDGKQIWQARVELLDGTPKDLTVDVSTGARWTVQIDLGPGKKKVIVKRAFIPARVEDNPALDADDYAATLAVGSVQLRRQLLEGDWSYSEDRVFGELADDVHKIDARWIFGEDRFGNANPCPRDWPRAVGQDHGTAKPTAAEWLAYDDEGYFIAYMEYYASGPVGVHVEAIKNMMIEDGHPETVIQCDPRMWHSSQGVHQSFSVADVYMHVGEPPTDRSLIKESMRKGLKIEQAKIENKPALLGMHEMLELREDAVFPYWHPKAGQAGAPMLYICQPQCPNLWRELKQLKHAEREDDGFYSEDIKNGQPDHAYDAIKRVAPKLLAKVRQPRRSKFGRVQLKRRAMAVA